MEDAAPRELAALGLGHLAPVIGRAGGGALMALENAELRALGAACFEIAVVREARPLDSSEQQSVAGAAAGAGRNRADRSLPARATMDRMDEPLRAFFKNLNMANVAQQVVDLGLTRADDLEYLDDLLSDPECTLNLMTKCKLKRIRNLWVEQRHGAPSGQGAASAPGLAGLAPPPAVLQEQRAEAAGGQTPSPTPAPTSPRASQHSGSGAVRGADGKRAADAVQDTAREAGDESKRPRISTAARKPADGGSATEEYSVCLDELPSPEEGRHLPVLTASVQQAGHFDLPQCPSVSAQDGSFKDPRVSAVAEQGHAGEQKQSQESNGKAAADNTSHGLLPRAAAPVARSPITPKSTVATPARGLNAKRSQNDADEGGEPARPSLAAGSAPIIGSRQPVDSQATREGEREVSARELSAPLLRRVLAKDEDQDVVLGEMMLHFSAREVKEASDLSQVLARPEVARGKMHLRLLPDQGLELGMWEEPGIHDVRCLEARSVWVPLHQGTLSGKVFRDKQAAGGEGSAAQAAGAEGSAAQQSCFLDDATFFSLRNLTERGDVVLLVSFEGEAEAGGQGGSVRRNRPRGAGIGASVSILLKADAISDDGVPASDLEDMPRMNSAAWKHAKDVSNLMGWLFPSAVDTGSARPAEAGVPFMYVRPYVRLLVCPDMS